MSDKLVKALVIGIAVILALLVIGAVVGGVLYGPRLSRALVAAERGRADTVTTQAGAQYQEDTAAHQARTQAAEVAVTVQMQESTREIQAAEGAGALVSADVYDAFRDGVQRNRAATPPGGAGAAGADPAP